MVSVCGDKNASLEICLTTKGSLLFERCLEEKKAFHTCLKEAKHKFNTEILPGLREEFINSRKPQ